MRKCRICDGNVFIVLPERQRGPSDRDRYILGEHTGQWVLVLCRNGSDRLERVLEWRVHEHQNCGSYEDDQP